MNINNHRNEKSNLWLILIQSLNIKLLSPVLTVLQEFRKFKMDSAIHTFSRDWMGVAFYMSLDLITTGEVS